MGISECKLDPNHDLRFKASTQPSVSNSRPERHEFDMLVYVDTDKEKTLKTESESFASILIVMNFREPLQISCLF